MEKLKFKDISTNHVFWVSSENSDLNMQFKKINKSHAICCDQKGYSNKRAVNCIFRFAAQKAVYIFSI